MTNEDAIKWLSNMKQDIEQLRHEDLWSYAQAEDLWPYTQVIDEIAEMLKEQEAEPQTVLFRDDGEYCPHCSTITSRAMGVQKLHRGTRFCPYCGKAVKWG